MLKQNQQILDHLKCLKYFNINVSTVKSWIKIYFEILVVGNSSKNSNIQIAHKCCGDKKLYWICTQHTFSLYIDEI